MKGRFYKRGKKWTYVVAIDIPDIVIDALQEQQGRLEKEKEAFGGRI